VGDHLLTFELADLLDPLADRRSPDHFHRGQHIGVLPSGQLTISTSLQNTAANVSAGGGTDSTRCVADLYGRRFHRRHCPRNAVSGSDDEQVQQRTIRDVAVNPAPAGLRDPHRQVTELEDFDDDPAKPNEAKLEAIQMAWYEEWKDARERVSPL